MGPTTVTTGGSGSGSGANGTFAGPASAAAAASSSYAPGNASSASSPVDQGLKVKFEDGVGGGAGAGAGTPGKEDGEEDARPVKKKQKRNKPTLSCEECVERKTKCDRGRPTCLACVKRQSECRYTHVANIIASADHGVAGNARYISRLPKRSASTMDARFNSTSPKKTLEKSSPRSSNASSPFLFSNVPFSKPTPSNVFGIGSEHPFANYWTCQGGLAEVVSVLPSKDQADILMEKYFEAVDPVYPMIHRRTFYAEYDHFWALPLDQKYETDAALLALHFVMYAMGTQFVQLSSQKERAQTAEFYVSASHQALRIFSYLNRTSLKSLQAMLLIAYFLMNDNHASDAWSFAGILIRQAYAMGLNRDPDIVVPNASALEKQQRRKIWQAVFFQDTFLTVLLKLPPTATHSDVGFDSLTEDVEEPPSPTDRTSTTSNVLNQMSITHIAPSAPSTPPPKVPLESHAKSDIAYIKCAWQLGNLVQETLCSPRSLNLPLCSTPRHKSSLLSSYRTLYRSFPPSLNSLDYASLRELAVVNPRLVRQNLFLTSNYFHCLMVLQADANEGAGVVCNVKGALDAAHEAISAFFALRSIFESEADVWWVFQHRAFEEALTMATLLNMHTPPTTTPTPLPPMNTMNPISSPSSSTLGPPSLNSPIPSIHSLLSPSYPGSAVNDPPLIPSYSPPPPGLPSLTPQPQPPSLQNYFGVSGPSPVPSMQATAFLAKSPGAMLPFPVPGSRPSPTPSMPSMPSLPHHSLQQPRPHHSPLHQHAQPRPPLPHTQSQPPPQHHPHPHPHPHHHTPTPSHHHPSPYSPTASALAPTSTSTPLHNPSQSAAQTDPVWTRARADVKKMLDVLERAAEVGSEMARTRADVLKRVYFGNGGEGTAP